MSTSMTASREAAQRSLRLREELTAAQRVLPHVAGRALQDIADEYGAVGVSFTCATCELPHLTSVAFEEGDADAVVGYLSRDPRFEEVANDPRVVELLELLYDADVNGSWRVGPVPTVLSSGITWSPLAEEHLSV